MTKIIPLLFATLLTPVATYGFIPTEEEMARRGVTESGDSAGGFPEQHGFTKSGEWRKDSTFGDYPPVITWQWIQPDKESVGVYLRKLPPEEGSGAEEIAHLYAESYRLTEEGADVSVREAEGDFIVEKTAPQGTKDILKIFKRENELWMVSAIVPGEGEDWEWAKTAIASFPDKASP